MAETKPTPIATVIVDPTKAVVSEGQEPPLLGTGSSSPNDQSHSDFPLVMVDVSKRSFSNRFSTRLLRREDKEEASGDYMKRWEACNKLVIELILIAMVIFVVVDSYRSQNLLLMYKDFLQWAEQNPVSGIFCFVVVYTVASTLFLPVDILTLGAGFLFAQKFGFVVGILLASCLVFVSATAGAYVSFFLGRYLIRDDFVAMTMDSPLLKALDLTAQDHGAILFSLLRFAPVIPFNAINYLAGISGIPFFGFVLATFAILPGIVLFVFLGASTPNLAEIGSSSGIDDENGIIDTTILAVSGVILVIFIGVTSMLVVKEMRKSQSRSPSQSEYSSHFDDASLCSFTTESAGPQDMYQNYL